MPAKGDLADDVSPELIQEILDTATNIAPPILEGIQQDGDIYTMYDDIEDGIPTYFPNLDKYISLPSAGVVEVRGRPGHGKSTVLLNLAYNLLKNTDRKIVFLTFEISKPEFNQRLAQIILGKRLDPNPSVDIKKYRELLRNHEYPIDVINEYVKTKRLTIVDKSATIEQVSKAMDILGKEKAIIFIDYVQLIPTTMLNGQRYNVIKEIMQNLREKANQYETLVVIGSQATMAEDPEMDRARESQDITNTAALVLKVWRKSAAKGAFEQLYCNDILGELIIKIEKSRQGWDNVKVGFEFLNGTLIKGA
jgi:replicative DNA helicase